MANSRDLSISPLITQLSSIDFLNLGNIGIGLDLNLEFKVMSL